MAEEKSDRLDRHVLVLAIWTPAVLAAAALIHRGLDGGPWWIAAGFAALLAGFAGHVVANAVLRSGFTAGETALGMAAFATAALSLGIGVLAAPSGVAPGVWLALALGLVALVVAVVLYLLIAFGARRAFERFDVIRDNNPRAASRLPHRGGRR